MARERFTWLGATCFPRPIPGRATQKLVQGAEYAVGDDFPASRVEEWVRTGHALYIAEAEPLPKAALKAKKAPKEK